MLPPIPQGLVPVTAQQDPVKQRPEIPVVAPPQQSEGAEDVALHNDDSAQVRERLRDMQRRQQERHAQQRQQEQAGDEEDGENEQALEQDGKKPLTRRGLWVDIKV